MVRNANRQRQPFALAFVDVRMPPGMEITGRVLDVGGRPVADAEVTAHLKPEGRFFFVDNAHNPSSVPIDSRRSARSAWRQTRQLGDGREFDIVKIFYEPEALAARLRDLGWQAEVRKTANHFLLAWGSRSGSSGGRGGALE